MVPSTDEGLGRLTKSIEEFWLEGYKGAPRASRFDLWIQPFGFGLTKISTPLAKRGFVG